MALRPGDVIRVWDRQIYPADFKRLIAIAPERQRFLRINSKPIYRPAHPIAAAGANFLDHDSYVELRNLVRPLAYEIAQADYLGALTHAHAVDLIQAVKLANTLSPEHKDLIVERLRYL